VAEQSLLALLHLCDSLFPTGAFAQSDGLEGATASGLITNARDLREWMTVSLREVFARLEGPVVRDAWSAFAAGEWQCLMAVDAEAYAMRPASTARLASRSMGTRLLRTWLQVRPQSRLRELPDERRDLTLPAAFGVVCAASDIALNEALSAFAYTRLAAIASAAMRLIAIGQGEAHTLVAGMLEEVPAVVDDVARLVEPPMSFVPAMDLAGMQQQYVHSRLFRS
jgi:urease accessory protein